MISSKKITVISLVLLALAIVFIVWVCVFYTPPVTGRQTKVYGEDEILYDSDDFFSGDSHLLSTKIELKGKSAAVSDNNVSTDGGDIHILKGGTYEFSGTLEGGSIRVNSLDGKPVYILLSNAHITSSGTSAIYVEESVKTVVTALDGTENSLTDTGTRKEDDDAVIYSRDDLTVNGKGSLTINANYADGIKCNDTLKIVDVSITISAADEGINANSCIGMLNSTADIVSGGDGIKCEDSEDTGKGFAAFDGAAINIESTDDGIWAYRNIYFENAVCTISAQVGDAIHSENKVYLNPERIDITQCYEGIEGSHITINGGKINVTSSDDAINAVGENSSGGRKMPMMNMKGDVTEENTYLTINGGTIVLNTGGDGIDTNGAAVVNGGHIEVYGPENSGNSSLDFEYGFVINGGTLLAAGSSGMAEGPHEASRQNSLVFYLDTTQTGEISLSDNSGKNMIVGESSKRFNWICISTPEITESEEYTLSINSEKAATLECTSAVTANREQGGFMRR